MKLCGQVWPYIRSVLNEYSNMIASISTEPVSFDSSVRQILAHVTPPTSTYKERDYINLQFFLCFFFFPKNVFQQKQVLQRIFIDMTNVYRMMYNLW